MDNRVIGIGIAVIGLALYVRGIPQRIWQLITAGNTTHLGDVLQPSLAAQGNQTVDAGNGSVPLSPGAIANGQSNGQLPGMSTGAGQTSVAIGTSIAQIISNHQAALRNTALDPELNQLMLNLPASNDPSVKTWLDAFTRCYGSGGSVSYCKQAAVDETGVSPFG